MERTDNLPGTLGHDETARCENGANNTLYEEGYPPCIVGVDEGAKVVRPDGKRVTKNVSGKFCASQSASLSNYLAFAGEIGLKRTWLGGDISLWYIGTMVLPETIRLVATSNN